MAVAKFDLFDGTTLTRGVIRSSRSRARRTALVTGLPNNANAWDAAITKALSGVGPAHPNNSSLLLQTVKVIRKISTTSAVVALDYFHSGTVTSGDDPGIIPPASFRLQSSALRWVQTLSKLGDDAEHRNASTGRPNGDINGVTYGAGGGPGGKALNSSEKPIYYNLPIGVMQIIVTTVTSGSPAAGVQAMVERVNSGGLSLGGMPIDSGELLFNGMNSDPVSTDGGIQYENQYSFAFARGGWLTQVARFTPTAIGGSSVGWEVQEYPLYDKAGFGGRFP